MFFLSDNSPLIREVERYKNVDLITLCLSLLNHILTTLTYAFFLFRSSFSF
jgi:hypothetical protein